MNISPLNSDVNTSFEISVTKRPEYQREKNKLAIKCDFNIANTVVVLKIDSFLSCGPGMKVKQFHEMLWEKSLDGYHVYQIVRVYLLSGKILQFSDLVDLVGSNVEC